MIPPREAVLQAGASTPINQTQAARHSPHAQRLVPGSREQQPDLLAQVRLSMSPGRSPARTPSAGTCNHHHQITLSRATINRILVRAGQVTPDPSKRPKSSYIRFEAEKPNETWQSDFTHYRLTHPDGRPGADVEIITWLDDHSRYALHITAHARVTAPIVLTTFTPGR